MSQSQSQSQDQRQSLGQRLGLSNERRFWVPEHRQTAEMDCGPTVMKALCQGYGLEAALETLGEAPLSDQSGTSLNQLESLCEALGIACELSLEYISKEAFFLDPATHDYCGAQ